MPNNDPKFRIGKIIVKSNEFTFDDDDVKSLDLIDQLAITVYGQKSGQMT